MIKTESRFLSLYYINLKRSVYKPCSQEHLVTVWTFLAYNLDVIFVRCNFRFNCLICLYSHKEWFDHKTCGQTILIRMYKKIGINLLWIDWLKVCLFLTWLQSSWKLSEACIWNESEQEIWFYGELQVFLGLK